MSVKDQAFRCHRCDRRLGPKSMHVYLVDLRLLLCVNCAQFWPNHYDVYYPNCNPSHDIMAHSVVLTKSAYRRKLESLAHKP